MNVFSICTVVCIQLLTAALPNHLLPQTNSGATEPAQEPDRVRFWHVTDFHFDPEYAKNGNLKFYCHAGGSEGGFSPQGIEGREVPGAFGHYKCDAPWTLVRSAVGAMKEFLPNPDFILWTGDSAPHLPDDVATQGSVLSIISNVTGAIESAFPGIPLYASFGNHDYWPTDQFPVNSNPVYEVSANMWSKHLNSNEAKAFIKLLTDYADVISGLYFGHLHRDIFMLLKSPSGQILRPVLVAPAVAPWHGSTNENRRNPAIRYIELDPTNGDLRLLRQFYLNLTAANQEAVQEGNDDQVQRPTKWVQHYRWAVPEGLNSAQFFAQKLNALRGNYGAENKETAFHEHLDRVFVNARPRRPCDGPCRRQHVCGIEFIDFPAFDFCNSNNSSTIRRWSLEYYSAFAFVISALTYFATRNLLCYL